MVGYDTGVLAFFDILSASLSSAQTVNTPQINNLVAHPTRTLVCTGHENGTINVFDYGSDAVVKSIPSAHSDAVSCLGISNTGLQLLSGGHDGHLKVWDLRKMDEPDADKQVQTTEPLHVVQNAHKMKYDEGVQGLMIHPTQPFVATGGADSIIQVFELFA